MAEKAAEKGMTIDSLTTSLRIGKNGKREFVIDAMVSSADMAHRATVDQMVNDLSSIKSELGLSHFDIFVHTGNLAKRTTVL